MTDGMSEARKTYTVIRGDELLKKKEDPLLAVRRSNQQIMRADLNKLRREADALYKIWLKKNGEYVTATKVAWANYYEKSREYKDLFAKIIENERE